MAIGKQRLAVTEIAEWCGVGRSTVGYWIRAGLPLARRKDEDVFLAPWPWIHGKRSRCPIVEG